jgi:hypothetical protein
MMKKALAAMALAGVAMTAQAAVQFEQGFDNVNSLAAQGWIRINASSPAGLTDWYQGDASKFTAQTGAINSYIAANYNNAAAGGTIDNWLISPVFDISKNGSVSFWLRGIDEAPYSDQVAFGFSDGSGAPGDFTMADAITAPTDGWTQYTIFYNTGAAGSTARFAIQYTGAADSSDYLGVDTFAVNVPEPTSALLFAVGALGLGAIRRRQRG